MESELGFLANNAKEISPGLYSKENMQRNEKSLVFDLGNGVAELVIKAGDNFGLNIITMDEEGTPYGCWFESTPDFPLSEVQPKEVDEQLLMNTLLGQAVLGDHRFLPLSRKKIKTDGDVIIMPTEKPKYWVRDAVHIAVMVGQEKQGQISRDEPNVEWYFRQVDMSKKIGQLSALLADQIKNHGEQVAGNLTETQAKSISVLLQAIPQMVENEYEESAKGIDWNLVERLMLFRKDDY